MRSMKRLTSKFWARARIIRSLNPVSDQFGFDRGTPIDRVFIENFLENHSNLISGEVLEIADNTYTARFGADSVTRSHVLHAAEGNSQATLVGNLETGENIPSSAFDCILLTQTLPFLYHVHAAISHCFRALRPGGTILATFAGISQISRYDADRWGDFWRFTPQSARRLFEEEFSSECVEVESYGNVLVACSFLHGLAAYELSQRELWHRDPDYPVLIAVKATKRAE